MAQKKWSRKTKVLVGVGATVLVAGVAVAIAVPLSLRKKDQGEFVEVTDQTAKAALAGKLGINDANIESVYYNDKTYEVKVIYSVDLEILTRKYETFRTAHHLSEYANSLFDVNKESVKITVVYDAQKAEVKNVNSSKEISGFTGERAIGFIKQELISPQDEIVKAFKAFQQGHTAAPEQPKQPDTSVQPQQPTQPDPLLIALEAVADKHFDVPLGTVVNVDYLAPLIASKVNKTPDEIKSLITITKADDIGEFVVMTTTGWTFTHVTSPASPIDAIYE